MSVTIGPLRDLCIERNYAVRTMLLLVLSLAVVMVVPIPAVAGDEVTVARIECPAQWKAIISWPHKIGEDPTFEHELAPEQEMTFKFLRIAQQDKQWIVCYYQTNAGPSGSYSYKVKRTIVSCTPAGERILDCTVKN